jgi:predicted O-linked N-acetylglucosamine transferase (SPINDLY family)
MNSYKPNDHLPNPPSHQQEKEMLLSLGATLQNPALTQSQLTDIIKHLKSFQNQRSTIAQFFLGIIYHSRLNDHKTAIHYYQQAHTLNPKFSHATFALAELTLTQNFVKAETLLLTHIFDQFTYDPYTNQTYFQPLQTLRAFTILAPFYPLATQQDAHKILEQSQLQKAEKLSQRIITLVTEETLPSNRSPLHIEAIKLAHQTLARVYNKIDKGSSEPSFNHYAQALTYHTNNLSNDERKRHNEIDKSLLEGASLAVNYFIPHPKTTHPLDWSTVVNRIYKPKPRSQPPNTSNYHPTPNQSKKSKIHLGYLSPDFNMNAVSLFLTAILKHHTPTSFKLYCYYARPDCDQYTKMMMKWPHIEWHHITYQTDEQVYKLMTQTHKLDILVDLISLGAANRLSLIAMKPAPIIINYLGYPNKCYHEAVTHRIVDHITDPEEHETPKGEQLVRLPRCFINFTLFENVPTPQILTVPHALDEIRIGIFNKSAKYSTPLLKTWLNILNKDPRIIFYLKQDERMHHDPTAYQAVADLFPPNRIKPLPVIDDLTAFYEQFNQVEFTIDTFPYSGTTTTCNSLYMGVPVVTLYNPKHPHAANVSASILKHTNEPSHYITGSLEEYEERILQLANDLPCKTLQDREERRERFLKAMEPKAFMREYEAALQEIYQSR